MLWYMNTDVQVTAVTNTSTAFLGMLITGMILIFWVISWCTQKFYKHQKKNHELLNSGYLKTFDLVTGTSGDWILTKSSKSITFQGYYPVWKFGDNLLSQSQINWAKMFCNKNLGVTPTSIYFLSLTKHNSRSEAYFWMGPLLLKRFCF